MKSALVVLVVALCAVNCAAQSEEEQGCRARSFNQDSVVCECDENYCDNPEAEENPEAGQFTVITSDRDGQRFAATTGTVQPLNNTVEEECYSIITNQTVNLIVNASQTSQTIIGFGGAFTDAVGYNLNRVSAGLVDQLFNTYFGKEGLRYNLARNTIANSDFSPNAYFYSNTEFDVNLTDFKIADEDYEYRIPYIKRAKDMAQDELLLLASVWTVPAWMRANNEDGKRVKVLREYYETYNLYIMKYLEAYEKEGLPHYAVNFANEPMVSMGVIARDVIDQRLEVWSLDELCDFAENHFMPALTAQFPDTKMLFFDENRNIITSIFLRVLRQRYPNVSQAIELAGFHSYFNSFISPSVLDNFHNTHPNATIISTELSTGTAGNLGPWAYAEYYATAFIEEMNHYTSGWVDWNLLLDTSAGPTFLNSTINAPVVFDIENNVFYKQPSFYAIGHFSRFIPRGSVKIGLESQFMTSLEYTCVLRPDGFKVAVLQNKSNSTVNVNIIKDDGIVNISAGPRSLNTVIFQ